MNAPFSKKQLGRFKTLCREKGLKVTPQRIAIYEEICGSDNHPTAEQVYAGVKRRFSTISLNTVNQTLLTFSQVGLVEVVEGFGSPRRYDPNLKTHHHVHCVKCGSILDVSNPQYDKLQAPQSIKREYDIITLKVILSGICSNCRKNNS